MRIIRHEKYKRAVVEDEVEGEGGGGGEGLGRGCELGKASRGHVNGGSNKWEQAGRRHTLLGLLRHHTLSAMPWQMAVDAC